jgi:hypothetical protein
VFFLKEYNSAFFDLYENLFLVLKEDLGEEKALKLFRKVMERGLKKAYDAASFRKGDSQDFVRVVGERDAGIGLRVEFPEVTGKKIVYRFYTDPFPNLNGSVAPEKLVDTYMRFKVDYLLGKNCSYEIVKHFWKGDGLTEIVIEKRR